MKSNRVQKGMALLAVVLTAGLALRAVADQSEPPAPSDQSYTGTVTAVNPNDHTLTVKGWAFWSKSFNLGDNCTYALLDNPAGTAGELRPGEKVVVNYQDAHGVLIADHVQQQPMQYVGTVTAIDPAKHTLTLEESAWSKQLVIADDCQVMLRGGKAGTLADIQPGNYVTVTYETPGGSPTAREIAQTSNTFTGTLTAIDLGEKTLKVKSLFDAKKFNVADNCAIVINGRPGGHLSDLRPDERLVVNYDEIDGVNVANCITPAAVAASSTTAGN